jgi:methionyl-tRNA formyltransferase
MHPATSTDVQLAPGELASDGSLLLVGAAGASALALDEVQMEGKPRMPGAQFAKDFQLRRGERLE